MNRSRHITDEEREMRPAKAKHNFSVGDLLFTAVLVLLVLGTLNVFSSTFYMNLRESGTISYYLIRHLIYIALGSGLGWFVYKWDYRTLRMAVPALSVGIIILLVMVLVFGVTVNGARRWLNFGFFTFQPSELAKLFAVMWAASQLTQLHEQKRLPRLWLSLFQTLSHLFGGRFKEARRALKAWRPLVMPLLFAICVYLQPDLGTVIFILGVPLLLYFLAGLPLVEIIATAVIGLLGFALAVIAAPYRWERVVAWYDPFSYARDLGYQVVQSIIAVGSGGILGQGFGQGHSKFAYLPEQYTDFAYAVFAQETGFFLSLVVPLLFFVILYCGWRIAARSQDRYGRYLAYGLTFMLVGQGLYNIAMCMGMVFVTGVPLPFISYGGSALVTNLIIVGVLLGIERKNRELAAEKAKREKVNALNADLKPPNRWEVPARN